MPQKDVQKSVHAADALDEHEAQEIIPRPVTKVLLINEKDNETFCGPGMSQLLEAISKTGTVRQACEEMNMSYSKGWKLLRRLEKWLGVQVTVRHQGGKGGGEAFLTQEGFDFLKKHTAFEKECQGAVEELFKKYYGDGQ
jgi:molybdate transport system regulatory protein